MLSLSLLEDLFSDIVILSNRFELEEDLLWNDISHKGPVMVITGSWHLAVLARRLVLDKAQKMEDLRQRRQDLSFYSTKILK